MGNFGAFVQKETIHILRDRRTMLIVLLIPVVLMFLFGFAISTEVNHVKVAVVAQQHTAGISGMVERIARNPYFDFQGYILPRQIGDCLRRGKAMAVVVFDKDFERKQVQMQAGIPAGPAVQIVVDAADPNTASASAMYLQQLLVDDNPMQRLFETRMLFNPQMKSAYNFVPGIMGLIFILVCALMTSVSIVREKEMGTMEVLLVSPVSPAKIIFSKMIPYFAISCITLAIILLLARFLLQVPMSGGVWGIVAVSLLYLMLALSLGLFVSNLARTQVVAMLVSAAVMMIPIIMLSGMIFPIENMPGILQGISCVIPARWYIDAMRKMMIEGLPLTAVMKDVAILAGMTLVLLVGATRKFNNKLE